MKDDTNPQQKIAALLEAVKAVRRAQNVHPTYEDEYLINKYKKEAARLFRVNLEHFIERA